jgi:alpha-L-arabinofuranosidase
MQLKVKHLILSLFMLVNAAFVFAQQKVIRIDAAKYIADINPSMYGVFFEDINLGADGGIYAELIKNRSFEFTKPLMGWKVEQKPFREGAVMVISRQEKDQQSNPRFLRVKLQNNRKDALVMTNEGFRGMGIKEGLRYDFSFLYRTKAEGLKMHIYLVSDAGQKIGGTTIEVENSKDEWKKHRVSFIATSRELRGKFSISFEGDGTIDLDMVSLFPSDTWKGRQGGMRADMVQMLADLKPGFLRFPGGCIVEGFDLEQRYRWKNTIGPIENRELIINRWNFEFAHKQAPDYFQTFGLGFFEYFQLAEDMGAEPLPILNCGMACQFNTAEVVPMEELEPYVQDALDLIEFANGPISSTWGKKRADMGHPEPFSLKYIGVGNENWGPQYLERLAVFQKAIKAKYPEIKIVGSSGTDPNGERFDLLNTEMRKMAIEIIDEHFYRRPEWFFENARRYDNYPRAGSKVFAGEYAAQSDRIASAQNKNNWRTALAEAAFLTGVERNADVVHLASYAPLFAHVDGWQWTPDLIWVDNLNVYGTPNYYVQKLFSLHKGNKVVPATYNNDLLAGQDSLYVSSVMDTGTKEVIIKIVNAKPQAEIITLDLAGVKTSGTEAKAWVMAYENDQLVNSIEEPMKVAPKEIFLPLKSRGFTYSTAGYSFNVIRIPLK